MNKQELRLNIKALLSALDKNYISESSLKIQNSVISSAEFKNSKSVFVYVSMKSEPKTRLIIKTALELGKNVYVPRCGEDFQMDCVKINSLDELYSGTMGIAEPIYNSELADKTQIEIAIIPCVCTSKNGKRLGHGAGYYDRFLQGFNGVKLCLCFEKLLRDDIPMDKNDIYMDTVITEDGWYQKL